MKKKQQGFTLLELMITLVVIAILTAVALPSYTSYVTRGKIPDATSNLSTRRAQMEQWFQDNQTYLANAAGVSTPACPASPDTTTSQNFDFSCTATATTFLLTATGKGAMAGFQYTIDQNNLKQSNITSPPAPSGWSAATPNNCWVVKQGGTC